MNQQLLEDFGKLFERKEELMKTPLPDKNNIHDMEEYHDAMMKAKSVQSSFAKINADYGKLLKIHGAELMDLYFNLYQSIQKEEYELCAKIRDKINETELDLSTVPKEAKIKRTYKKKDLC